jgi:hypothetical protein
MTRDFPRQPRRPSLPPPPADVEQEDLDEDDQGWPQRPPSSARRYQALTTHDGYTRGGPAGARAVSPSLGRRATLSPRNGVPPRRSATTDEQPGPSLLPAPKGRLQRAHWLLLVGLALCTMLVGWVVLTLLSSWWQVAQDDWHYGRPRTYQVDVVVGHADSASHPSHFIALNLDSHIEVIEFPGGDAAKAKIYLGPTLIGQGEDLAVVTLTFKDVSGHGKLDMIINVADSHFVFINEQGAFRPARPGEAVTP